MLKILTKKTLNYVMIVEKFCTNIKLFMC